jgi:hypothetical protein
MGIAVDMWAVIVEWVLRLELDRSWRIHRE